MIRRNTRQIDRGAKFYRCLNDGTVQEAECHYAQVLSIEGTIQCVVMALPYKQNSVSHEERITLRHWFRSSESALTDYRRWLWNKRDCHKRKALEFEHRFYASLDTLSPRQQAQMQKLSDILWPPDGTTRGRTLTFPYNIDATRARKHD